MEGLYHKPPYPHRYDASMHITTLYQSRSAHLRTDISRALESTHLPLPGDKVYIASTNVPHSDDPEMQARLDVRKHAYATIFAEHGVEPIHLDASHQLAESITNLAGHTLIVDSLNLNASNTWLRNNSLPHDATAALIADEIENFLAALSLLAASAAFSHVILLTNEVAADFDIRSIHLMQYATFITAMNDRVAKATVQLASTIPHLTQSAYIAGSVMMPLSETYRG